MVPGAGVELRLATEKDPGRGRHGTMVPYPRGNCAGAWHAPLPRVDVLVPELELVSCGTDHPWADTNSHVYVWHVGTAQLWRYTASGGPLVCTWSRSVV